MFFTYLINNHIHMLYPHVLLASETVCFIGVREEECTMYLFKFYDYV